MIAVGFKKPGLALALLILPVAGLAQTAQNEKLKEIVSKLKACVETHAPAAQAAGIKNTNVAVGFFLEMCTPPLSITVLTNPNVVPPARPGALSGNDLTDLGAVPPGTFRRAISEEWARFVEKPQDH